MLPDPTRLRTLQQFAKEAPAFPVATLRHWIRYAATNGFEGCYFRIGGRLYVDPTAIAEWFAAQQHEPRAHDRGIAMKRQAAKPKGTW